MQTNITGMCRECSECLGHTGFAPTHGLCAFPVYTAYTPGCSAGKLFMAGPGLHALRRSTLLSFRLSGTPQKHRFSWASILCPSQVQTAQVTRCLASAHSPGVVHFITSPVPATGLLGAQWESCPMCAGVLCVSSGELISGCDPPGACQLSRIPGTFG